MSLLESQDLSVSAVMESPLSTHLQFSAPPNTATPAQRPLLNRNAQMLDAMTHAISESESSGQLISSRTVWMAKRFLQLLPADVPPTDSYVTENQGICFDWDEVVTNQMSVIVQGNS